MEGEYKKRDVGIRGGSCYRYQSNRGASHLAINKQNRSDAIKLVLLFVCFSVFFFVRLEVIMLAYNIYYIFYIIIYIVDVQIETETETKTKQNARNTETNE